MTSLGLFFVGAVLLVNGLNLLGLVGAAAAAPINAFVGALLAGVAAFEVVPVGDLGVPANQDVVLGGVGFLLFAFTYLWVALNHWTGAQGHGLGWYCLWSAGVSVLLAIVNFLRLADPRIGMLWLLWAVLFGFFFAVLALDRAELARVTGWVTVVQSFVTATIPGALLLLGYWERVPGWSAVAVGVGVLLVFGTLALRSDPAVSRETLTPEHV